MSDFEPPWHPASFVSGSVTLGIPLNYTVPTNSRAILTSLFMNPEVALPGTVSLVLYGAGTIFFRLSVSNSPPDYFPEILNSFWYPLNSGDVISALFSLDSGIGTPTDRIWVVLGGWLIAE